MVDAVEEDDIVAGYLQINKNFLDDHQKNILKRTYVRVKLVEVVGVQLLTALRLREEILEELVLVDFRPEGAHILICDLNLRHTEVLLHQENVLRVEAWLE